MKNKISLFAIASLAVSAFSHADIKKQDSKTFKADGYTHAVDEVELTDWSNPDLEWCSSVSTLRANCLRLMPTQAKEIVLEGKPYVAIPLRSHLFFKDIKYLTGTVYYYGYVLIEPKSGQIGVQLDKDKVKYSQSIEFGSATLAGLDNPVDYVSKMEILLKDYFEKSKDFKLLLETDTFLKFVIEEIIKTGKFPTDK